MAPTPAKKSKLADDEQLIKTLITSKSERINYIECGRVNKDFKVFKRVLIDNESTNYVICSTCDDKNLIKYDIEKGSNTIKYHLKSNLHTKKPDIKKQSVDKLFYKKISAEDKKKICDLISLWCASDNRPFNIVESDSFINFIQGVIKLSSSHGLINAKELIPCADTVRKHVTVIDQELRLLLVAYMQMVDNVCCTSDHWKDEISNMSYMTICIHYFDTCKEQLYNRIIGTFAVDNGCSDTTADSFNHKMNQLSLDSKVRIVVTDSAPAMISAFSDTDWISCSAHNLARLQKWSFNEQEPKQSPDPIKSITTLISQSKALVKKVKKGNHSFDLKCKLIQECPTRWDTVFDMLDSISTNYNELEQQNELQSFMDAINPGLLHELLSILKPLKELRIRLCMDSKITINRVALTYHAIIDLTKMKPKDSAPISMLKLRFFKFLPEKFEISPYHIISTLLTPEFRSFRFCKQSIVDKAVLKLNVLLEEAPESDPEDEAKDIESNDTGISDDIFSRYREKPSKQSRVADELETYCTAPLTALEIDTDPFKFWINNQVRYPKLSKIALWLLACPASNTSSERCFSAAGNVLTPSRNRLDPDIVDKLLFMRSNKDLL